MAGSALSLFTDFFSHTTGPAYLTSPSEVINDAQLRNYEALDAFYRSKREVQGGTTIKDMILLNDPLTAGTYLPGEAATITNVQGGSTISIPWRFVRVPITWTEAEILLNQGGSGQSKTDQFQQFKKLKEFKYQQAYTSLLNKLENLYFASASSATMEANSGQEPYSVFATVTSTGLAPSGFTTVQGINPSSEPKWRNQTASYTASSPLDGDVGIIGGFDEMSQLVAFKRPPNAAQYFSESNWNRLVIFTNREGRRDYMKALRSNNDITRAGPQDPSFGDPVFNNIPVRAAEGLDEAGSFTTGEPDYLFLNMNYIKAVFHRDKFMQVSDVLGFADKPDTKVVWVDSYCNLFNCSRQRQGYLSGT